MYKGKTIAVVVPAYNEEKLIGSVIQRMPDYIDRVFIVDDCSQDNTAAVVNAMIAKQQAQNPSPKTVNCKLKTVNSRLTLITHPVNQGVGKAITTGYKASLQEKIDISVVMAGDNQMDPVQLPRLLDPIVEGKADYTVGDRLSNLKHQKGMSPWRRLGNFLLKWLTRIAAWNMVITDPQNGYTAVSREALEKLASLGRSASPNSKLTTSSNSPGCHPEEGAARREDLCKLSTVNCELSYLDHIYPRYGYCNDMLVKFSGTGARIRQIQMPAVYGEEKSKIKYHKYIPTVSWLLLKGFLWRISMVFSRERTHVNS